MEALKNNLRIIVDISDPQRNGDIVLRWWIENQTDNGRLGVWFRDWGKMDL